MARARSLENVIKICTDDGTMENLLPHMFEQLELCQKSLAGYLHLLIMPKKIKLNNGILS